MEVESPLEADLLYLLYGIDSLSDNETDTNDDDQPIDDIKIFRYGSHDEGEDESALPDPFTQGADSWTPSSHQKQSMEIMEQETIDPVLPLLVRIPISVMVTTVKPQVPIVPQRIRKRRVQPDKLFSCPVDVHSNCDSTHGITVVMISPPPPIPLIPERESSPDWIHKAMNNHGQCLYHELDNGDTDGQDISHADETNEDAITEAVNLHEDLPTNSSVTKPRRDKYVISIPATQQHVQNVGLVIECDKCHMWRLMFSQTKLSYQSFIKLTWILHNALYTCGDTLKDVLTDDLSSVCVRYHQCFSRIELLYYSCGFSDTICVYCSKILPNTPMISSTYKYPQCTDCADRPPLKKRGRKK